MEIEIAGLRGEANEQRRAGLVARAATGGELLEDVGVLLQIQAQARLAGLLELAPEGKSLKIGTEIGWLGFPAVAPAELCFFSGRVSAVRNSGREYLVDGVAINGVSGGPAFWNGGDSVTLIGVMSAYIANRATGETLPGLTVIQNVHQFHEVSKLFKNVDDAKQQEKQPEQPPAPPIEVGQATTPSSHASGRSK